ncbi:MAG: 2-phospho-L-lactate transferase [Nitrososphaerales archaeon]
MLITILAGGTGSAKLVRGVSTVTKDFSVICNVGDNIWIHGLYVCPDVDTIVYVLADILDSDRGWGIKHDSFEFNKQLKILGEESWFNIGDKDLATHLVRTKMRREGKGLFEIMKYVCDKIGVTANIIPVTETHVETRVVTEEGEMHLQQFWVKNHAKGKVKDVRYHGANRAKPTLQAIDAIKSSNMIIIAPGNPISSIAPMIAIKGIKDILTKLKGKCVAVSPIIGSKPVSGPAEKYMEAVGVEVSPYGVAKFYSDFVSKFVMQRSDRSYARKIEDLGMKAYDTNIIMKDKEDESRLASYLIGLQKSVLH